MKPLALALCAASLAALLGGCATSAPRSPASAPAPGSTHARAGQVVAQEYRSIDIGEDRARLAVTFAPGSPCPPTRWYLLDGRGHERRRPATAPAEPLRPGACEAETRALMFEIDPVFAAVCPGFTPPEPRMITLIERQLLVVTISYRRPAEKEPPGRQGAKTGM